MAVNFDHFLETCIDKYQDKIETETVKELNSQAPQGETGALRRSHFGVKGHNEVKFYSSEQYAQYVIGGRKAQGPREKLYAFEIDGKAIFTHSTSAVSPNAYNEKALESLGFK